MWHEWAYRKACRYENHRKGTQRNLQRGGEVISGLIICSLGKEKSFLEGLFVNPNNYVWCFLQDKIVYT